MKKQNLAIICIAVFMAKGCAHPHDIRLPDPNRQGKVTLERAINERHSVRTFADAAVSLAEISQVLWAAYGTNARQGMTVPSAGGLYPLSFYLVAGNVSDVPSGIYRYGTAKHELIPVKSGDHREALRKAALDQPWVEQASAIIVICADYRVTASRYGERAGRYVDIEVGHAGQNIYLQAQALSLGTVAVGSFDDAAVKKVLDIDQEPVYLMPLGRDK